VLTDTTPSPAQNQILNGDLAQATSGSSSPVPLESGSQSETDQVTLVYALEAR
jgi:uncharacterized protein YggE